MWGVMFCNSKMSICNYTGNLANSCFWQNTSQKYNNNTTTTTNIQCNY